MSRVKEIKLRSPADVQLRTWLEKYTPVEQAIMEARARRLENAARRRQRRSRRFGDLCEATGGLAAYWRRIGVPLEQQAEWVKGDAFAAACLVGYYGRSVTRQMDRLRHAIKRPLYYDAENLRRRELAVARRKITRRTTENPCPTREEILDAWTHRRESHAAAIRFGSLIEDLECYLDNSLRFDERGAIVGRNGGVKRWLQEAIPALYLRYTTVMRFKAAAHKMRQITGIADPTPASRVVDDEAVHCQIKLEAGETDSHGTETCRSGEKSEDDALKTQNGVAGGKRLDGVLGGVNRSIVAPSVELVRAQAIWREVVAGVAKSPTALFARLDALLDPKRVEDVNMLSGWRRKYENEITVRTKNLWWRRLGSGWGIGGLIGEGSGL